MESKYNRLTELIKDQFSRGYLDARCCHRKLFSEPQDFEAEQKALIYLNRAARHMDLAYTVYQSYFEELEHYGITPVFEAFDAFYDETTDNVATNHGHQWSDIAFKKYKETLYDWVPEARED